MYSSLYGSSVDVNVRLDRNSVRLENTYIGLSTQRYIHTYTHYTVIFTVDSTSIQMHRFVTLYNRSKVVVHYQWKAFSSVEEEKAQKEL